MEKKVYWCFYLNFEHLPYTIFLGGTLGLFTGMSIMSMIEIVFWAFKYILNFLRGLISTLKKLRRSFKNLRGDTNPI